MSIGIGIIGSGGISRAHAEAYRQLSKDAHIVAVADIDAQRAREAASSWGVEHAFEDYRELLDLEAVDAVSVCTYTRAHCAPVVAALQAGKHVLVEKPMAATTAEAWEMVQAARASTGLLMVEMKWRFMPQLLAARQAIARGDLGTLYYAEALGWQHRGIPGRSFIRRELAGGGALMDNGIYTLDAALYLMGHPRPLTVSGAAANIFGHAADATWDTRAFSVEDFGTAFVRLEGGITLSFAHSWAINFKDQWQVRIAGAQGSAEIYPFAPAPGLRITKGGYGNLQDVTPAVLPAGSTEIAYAVGKFVQAIQNGTPSPVPGDTFLYSNAIFDALYQSAQEDREIVVELPGD